MAEVLSDYHDDPQKPRKVGLLADTQAGLGLDEVTHVIARTVWDDPVDIVVGRMGGCDMFVILQEDAEFWSAADNLDVLIDLGVEHVITLLDSERRPAEDGVVLAASVWSAHHHLTHAVITIDSRVSESRYKALSAYLGTDCGLGTGPRQPGKPSGEE